MTDEFTKFHVAATLGTTQISDTIEARNACAALTVFRTKLHPLFPQFDDTCSAIDVRKRYEDGGQMPF